LAGGAVVAENVAMDARVLVLMDMIKLERYPLDYPQSEEYRRVVGECGRDLARTGLVNLEGFLTPEGTSRLVGDIEALLPEAHYAERRDNPYGAPISDELADDHPYRILSPTARHGIAMHQMHGTALEDLYRWPPLRQFVADLTGYGKLYLHDDPSNALVAQIYKTGGGLAWHFDRALFSTILNLQETEGGGTFECVPGLRKPDNPCFDEVRDVLLGRSQRVEQHHAKPGSFSIMLGRDALHRVTTIDGPTPRMSLILSYEDRPGVRLDVPTRRKFFGPAAPDDV
jgi:alkylated DNA repair dioxygenase AlkB